MEARIDEISLDYVQQALIHEEMKQSELSGLLSEVESALKGAFGIGAIEIGPQVLDVVLWVTFTVIAHVIGLHVLDVVVWVIFAVIVPRNLNGTKQNWPRVTSADRKILTLKVRMFMLLHIDHC